MLGAETGTCATLELAQEEIELVGKRGVREAHVVHGEPSIAVDGVAARDADDPVTYLETRARVGQRVDLAIRKVARTSA